MHVPHSHRARRSPRRAAAAALALATVGGTLSLLAAPAGATTIDYVGTTTGTQSSLTIHRGDAFERVLNPTGSVSATLDDASDTIVGGQVSLDSSYTPTFAGPFGVLVYVKTDLEQLGETTGTTSPGATVGTSNLSVHAATRLRVTVYATKDGIQRPATDGTLSKPEKCFVDLDLALTGTADRRTGALSLGADPFTIPTFPDGKVDPLLTCGLATGSLNKQLAGANNAISLNFSGGPTRAHYTGKTTGTQSNIKIKNGDLLFARTINPTGTLTADIDFVSGAVTNVAAPFDELNISALPGVLSAFPANANIKLSNVGTPVSSITPSGTPGIDNVKVALTQRMAVKVSLFKNPGVALTNPAKCYVDLKLNLTGTVDRGTNTLKLAQPKFTIPNFTFGGCGLMGSGLNLLVAGANNSIALTYVDAS